MITRYFNAVTSHPLEPQKPDRQSPPHIQEPPRKPPVSRPKRWDFRGYFSYPDFDMLKMMHSRQGVAEMLTPSPPQEDPISPWQRVKNAFWNFWSRKSDKPESFELTRLNTAPGASSSTRSSALIARLTRLLK